MIREQAFNTLQFKRPGRGERGQVANLGQATVPDGHYPNVPDSVTSWFPKLGEGVGESLFASAPLIPDRTPIPISGTTF
jgi:hypothetical protein